MTMPTDSLEQQALDRVARMYASYDRRQPHRPPHRPPEEPLQKPTQEHEHPEREPQAPEPPATKEPAAKPKGLLEALMEDQEQSLILLLLIILMKDGADLNLILALMYLVI